MVALKTDLLFGGRKVKSRQDFNTQVGEKRYPRGIYVAQRIQKYPKMD